MPSRLGLNPKRLWKKGDPRVAPNGRVIGGINSQSYCVFEFEGQKEKCLPDGLKRILDVLMPHKDYLHELVARGVQLSFFVGWFSEDNSRDVLDWQILRDLADLKISLDLDIYGPDAESDAPDQAR